MVNFTCNTCGDSLKKKDVTLHFSRKIKCHEALSLTCFDCLKEFGQDFVSHTICVTEDQRYSANGLSGVAKNKQQVWSEMVHSTVKSYLLTKGSTLSPSVKKALEQLCQVASIPKKEKPFMNFFRNLRRFQEDDIRTTWKIVQEISKQEEEVKTETKKDVKTDNTKKDVDTNNVSPTTNGKPHKSKNIASSKPIDEVAAEENKLSDDSEQKKKKKKSKKVAESSEEVEDTNINKEDSNNLNESTRKKNKKEKSAETSQITEDIPMEVEENVGEVKAEEEKLSKKEKKLKKKQEKFEAQLKSIEAANTGEEAEITEEPAAEEGKKKKSKKHDLEAEEVLETNKKSKKKRERTVSMAAEPDLPKKKNKQKDIDENTEPNETEEVAPSRKDFNWNDVIVQVLQSQDDKEMSIKRLCKKVVNEYLSSLLEGAYVDEVKATAKFQKKLNKTPGVFVHKDKAKLKATD